MESDRSSTNFGDIQVSEKSIKIDVLHGIWTHGHEIGEFESIFGIIFEIRKILVFDFLAIQKIEVS